MFLLLSNARTGLVPTLGVGLGLLLLSACAHPDFKYAARAPIALERDAISAQDYRLSPGDQVRLSVFGEPEISGDFKIIDQGYVALPTIGRIEASGLTIGELRSVVAEKLHAHVVVNPIVTLVLLAHRPLYVGGEVRSPGKVDYEIGMTVRDAISSAGGYTYRSDYGKVFIRAKDQPAGQLYDLRNTRIPVHPGDFIRVGERYF
ncbi:MAG: polysaccharide biosynthesis/export family protein [Pseudomonadota bacterium]